MMNYTTEPATLSLFPALGSAYDQAESLYDEDDDAHSMTSSASSSLSEPHTSPDSFGRQRQVSLECGMHTHTSVQPPTPDFSRQRQLPLDYDYDDLYRSADRTRVSVDIDVRHLPDSPPELRRSEGAQHILSHGAISARTKKQEFTTSQFGEPVEISNHEEWWQALRKSDC